MSNKKKRKSKQGSASKRNLKFNNKKTGLLEFINSPIVSAVLGAIIATSLFHVYPLKLFSRIPDSPSLHIKPTSIGTSVNLALKLPDEKDEYCEIIATGECTAFAFDFTNNDERTLVINEINFVLSNYEPIRDAAIYSTPWRGAYAEYIYYGVQVGDSPGDYPCVLLSGEALADLYTNRKFPSTSAPSTFIEHIEGKGCDSVLLFVSTAVSGIYRYKIRIDYSIGGSEKSVETEEMIFASLSPEEWSELEIHPI